MSAIQETTPQEPWVGSLGGKIRWRRNWQPRPVSLPGKSHAQRSLAGLQSMESQKGWTRLSNWTATTNNVSGSGVGLSAHERRTYKTHGPNEENTPEMKLNWDFKLIAEREFFYTSWTGEISFILICPINIGN